MIFRRLLEKITTENSFQLNSKFFKQTDGCAIGGPLSVTLSDIWMVKMENNIVIPHKPIFYKRYVDDIINRRKKHEEDLLFKKLNDYHPKIKLTIEINPPKFLDTEITILNNEVVTSVHRKESKLSVSISNLYPLKDKDLHPACKIYKGICSCESTYVGETKRNVEEHNHLSGKSEPSKHLYQNINHVFTWSVICSAPKTDRTRKNLEVFYIALVRPNLNEQCDSTVLTLFRNGIT